MRRWISLLALFAALAAAQPVAAVTAAGGVSNFGPNLELPCPNPEGIAIDPTGNLYASSFPVFTQHTSANICVVSASGQLVRTITIAPGSGGVTNLLGELYEPGQGLYVVDFANGTAPNGRLLKVDVATGAIHTLATGFAAANAIAQDRHRTLFISDSFQGTITKVAPDGSTSTWFQSPALTPSGFPPFGANGVAFDRDQANLYVAQTSTDTVYRIPVNPDGSAGAMTVFAQGTGGELDGADGIMFDVHGNLYVCANQANEVQVLSPGGQLIARYSGSGGNVLDFPASLVFKGRSLYVTNLSLLDGGINSKLSVVSVPVPGLPLHP